MQIHFEASIQPYATVAEQVARPFLTLVVDKCYCKVHDHPWRVGEIRHLSELDCVTVSYTRSVTVRTAYHLPAVANIELQQYDNIVFQVW